MSEKDGEWEREKERRDGEKREGERSDVNIALMFMYEILK